MKLSHLTEFEKNSIAIIVIVVVAAIAGYLFERWVKNMPEVDENDETFLN